MYAGESLGNHIEENGSRWVDWTEALNMLRNDGLHTGTGETAGFVHPLTEIGPKTDLLVGV